MVLEIKKSIGGNMNLVKVLEYIWKWNSSNTKPSFFWNCNSINKSRKVKTDLFSSSIGVINNGIDQAFIRY